MVGPILSEAAKPLPADLAAFVESGKASRHGAVYVSMGTAARLTAAELHSLSKSLSAIPNPVLWKLSDYDLPSEATFVCFIMYLVFGVCFQVAFAAVLLYSLS